MKNHSIVILTLALSLSASRTHAAIQVVGTLGDTNETVCLAPSSSHLWVGTTGAGMMRTDGTTWSDFDARVGLLGNHVNDCQWHNGTVYVATSAGLSKLDPHSKLFVTVSEERFVKLASAGETLVAANDRSEVVLFKKSNQQRIVVDLSIVSLFGAQDGTWAAGGVDGRIFRSDKPVHSKVKGPVLSLGVVDDKLMTTTPYRMDAYFAADGTSFDTKELSHLWVTDVAQFKGDSFATTQVGLFKKQDGKWILKTRPSHECGDRISALAQFDGKLWVGSFDRGLCLLDQGRWTRFSGLEYLASDMINDLASDNEHLWVATRSGLTIVDRELNFEVLTHEMCIENRKKDCPWHAAVNGVTVDASNGQVWVADVGAVHQVKSPRWKRFYHKLGITTRSLSRIAAWGGQVAVGTTHQGILYRQSTGKFKTIDDKHGLADNWVMDLSFDGKGNLWVATCTKGVSRFDGKRWRTIASKDGLVDDYTLSVKEIGGDIWIGTLSGLSILSKGKISNITAADGLSGNEVHDFLEHDGLVYLATDGGLTVLSNQ